MMQISLSFFHHRLLLDSIIVDPIFLQDCHDLLSIREDQLCHRLPERVHDVGDEPDLALSHVDCVPITERGDLEALLPLLVPLLEALLHQPVHPLRVEGQRLGRVGQVAAVNQVL